MQLEKLEQNRQKIENIVDKAKKVVNKSFRQRKGVSKTGVLSSRVGASSVERSPKMRPGLFNSNSGEETLQLPNITSPGPSKIIHTDLRQTNQ